MMNLPKFPSPENSQTEAAHKMLWVSPCQELPKNQGSSVCGKLNGGRKNFRRRRGLFPTNVTVLEPFHAGYTLVGISD